jgi:hypothetical protein
MAKLGAAADAQDTVFANLGAAAGNLKRFFADLQPFSRESLPSLRSLGQASKTGTPAVKAASPLVSHLNQFAKHTPELAQNLAIVLHDLDDRGRAVESDPRSPGGKGYSGLEGLLEYVFNITNAVNYFGPYGHLLGVDGFVDQLCSPYTTPHSLANEIAANGADAVRRCYAFLGPNQPGVTTPDPSFDPKKATPANPSACVPDPGGFPEFPGYKTNYHGVQTNACKLQGSSGPAADQSSATKGKPAAAAAKTAPSATGGVAATGSSTPAAPPINLGQTLGQILTKVKGVVSSATGAAQGAGSDKNGLSGTETQQLLNYLLAP